MPWRADTAHASATAEYHRRHRMRHPPAHMSPRQHAYFEIPAEVATDPLALDCRIAVRILALKKLDKHRDAAAWAAINEEIGILEWLLDRLKKQIKRRARRTQKAIGYNKPVMAKGKVLKAPQGRKVRKPIPGYVVIPRRKKDEEEEPI